MRVALAALLAATLIGWGASRYGLALLPDSVQYIQAARSLASGHGYPASAQAWPPGYAALLAVPSRLMGSDPLDIATPLALLLYALLVVLTLDLLHLHGVRSSSLRLSAVLGLVLSTTLLNIGLAALSELPFCVWIMAALAALMRGVQRSHRGWLFIAGVCAGLAMLTRFIGITVLPALCLPLLLVRGWRGTQRCVALLLILLPAAVLPLWWTLHSLHAGLPVFGVRTASQLAIADIVQCIGTTLLAMQPLPILAATALLTVLGLRLPVATAMRASLRLPFSALPAWVLSYVAGLALLAARVQFDEIDERLLSPLLAPLLVCGLVLIAGPLQGLASQRRQWAQGLGAALLLALLAGMAGPALFVLDNAHRNGAGGYNVRYWREQPLLQQLVRLRADLPVYSNAPEVLQLFLGWDAHMSPRLDEASLPWPSAPRVLLVWFAAAEWRGYLQPRDAVLSRAPARQLTTTGDAWLYEISSVPATAAAP